MSHVTCHMSHIPCHVSHFMCNMSDVFFFFFKSGKAYCWRVFFQRGLPRLVVTPVYRRPLPTQSVQIPDQFQKKFFLKHICRLCCGNFSTGIPCHCCLYIKVIFAIFFLYHHHHHLYDTRILHYVPFRTQKMANDI